jgi:hypothetical protein
MKPGTIFTWGRRGRQKLPGRLVCAAQQPCSLAPKRKKEPAIKDKAEPAVIGWPELWKEVAGSFWQRLC